MSERPEHNPQERSAWASNRRMLLHQLSEYELARKERDAAEARLAGFAETIQHLIDNLPDDERRDFQRKFEALRGPVPQPHRGGEVYGNVIELFKRHPNRREWRIPEIQAALEEQGAAPADPKALYNTISYFAKIGVLQRISRGHYAIGGVGVVVDMEDVDDRIHRVTEHDI